MKNVYITSASRTAVGSLNKSLKNIPGHELGSVVINEAIKVSKIGKIAGCIVTEGAIKRNTKLRILRGNIVIHSGDLDNLKRHSDEAKEVKEGLECGISIQNFNDIQVEDVIECYEIEKTPRKLVENN